jgi:nitroreductase
LIVNTSMRPTLKIFLLASLSLSLRLALAADELKPVALPPPQMEGGKPLMETLRERRTTREFKPDRLPPQLLANLLWAAFGINRPQTGQRTAPSAMNSQEVELYVAMPEGLFVYDAKSNVLAPVVAGDVRPRAGGQDSFKQAPVTLVYVAQLPRLAKAKPESRPFYADFDAGCICQNVYLFCASAGLATVVHDLDRAPLAEAMRLKPDQQIILAQAVGFPKNPEEISGGGRR